MKRCINFEEFKATCPLNHDVVIHLLIERYFEAPAGKRKENVAKNLSAIIDATFTLANQMGFAKMSMRDLHKACGMSLGGLYNYFESKEALAMMITDALHHIAFDWLPSLLQPNMGKQEKLEQLIRGHIYLSQILRPWFYFVFMEIKNLPDANKAKAREVELNFQRLLESIYGTPLLPASHIMALMQDWHVKHWKYRDICIDDFADSVNNIGQSCLQ